jgi:hypothetical protein
MTDLPLLDIPAWAAYGACWRLLRSAVPGASSSLVLISSGGPGGGRERPGPAARLTAWGGSRSARAWC